MANLVGMELRERWGSWDKDPYNSDSNSHITTYQRRVAHSD